MLHSTNYLSETLLRQSDFYEIFPLDGGGYFSMLDLAGGIKDRAIADAVVDGSLFDPFRNAAGEVDWELCDRWDCIEKGVWLNRWYWLASTARMYWLTRRETYARTTVDCINAWRSAVERPAEAEYDAYQRTFWEGVRSGDRISTNRACSTWCDFQLAQRIIVGYWIDWFLRDAAAWGDSDRRRFREMMIDHARLLFRHDRDGRFEEGNHQVVRAFALLHAAVLSGDLEEAASWWKLGVDLMNEHAGRDFTAEGVGREGSYSYLLFQLSQYAHAVALAKASGHEAPARWIELTQAMTRFLQAAATPAGTTPVVNDGYEAELAPVLGICRTLIPDLDQAARTAGAVARQPAALERFSDGRCVVMRTQAGAVRFWTLIDAMPPYGNAGHWHAGKPTVQVWVGDQPLLGECGCPNYDDPLYGPWFRRGPAHFAVTVDEQEDARFLADVLWDCTPEIRAVRMLQTDQGASMEYESNGFQRLSDPVSYIRQVRAEVGRGLTITDTLRSSGGTPHRFRVHIPFLTREVRLTGQRSATAIVDGTPVEVNWNLGQAALSKRPVSVGKRQGEYPYLMLEAPQAVEAEFIVQVRPVPTEGHG